MSDGRANNRADIAHERSVHFATVRRNAMFARYDELREMGESPLVACERLGVKPANLMRTAYRWERNDIGKDLAAYVGQDRKR